MQPKKNNAIKQIKRLETESIETIESDGEDLKHLKMSLLEFISKSYATPNGLLQVEPRLRQLLLPKGSDYMAITPLPCGSLSKEINRRTQAHNELAKDRNQKFIDTGILGIGGSKPQNVSLYAKDLSSPLYFATPAENRVIRAAWAIHHQGIAIRLPYRAMLAWKTWREQVAAQHGGQIPTDMRHRDRERQLVLDVAQGVLMQGRKALRLLEKQRDLLGEHFLSDELTDTVIRGLIDPSQRDKAWPRTFAERIATAIGRYKTGDDLFLPLDGGSLQRIARWLEEAVR
ncbi:hypothetical protein NP590_12095 [Methylomonas sp. SURF-2]|uniref:Uncharacterized protein n=1 Tax=Methylomonas subterranea TaxID=2952225 RepID=A0ABT1THB7_9GAMM|nr:hypothetical protein [Methylomonas sp. SURF-2]MCQ8104848.1 hypothetical protein [Methylomonas sp. SURF-2]